MPYCKIGGSPRCCLVYLCLFLRSVHAMLLQSALILCGAEICSNCHPLQALMAVGPFCQFLQQLVAAVPALDTQRTPTLVALAKLGAEFEPVKPPPPPEEQEEGWSVKVTKAKRQKAASQSVAAASSSSSSTSTAAATLPPLSAVLGGKPLSPSMMNGVVAAFNPKRAKSLSDIPAGANGRLSQSQMNSYKQAAATGNLEQQEQEDAQEFLQFVVMAAHEEVLKLRSNLPAAGQPNTAAADAANSSSRQQQAADNASKQADSSHNKQTQEDPEEWSVVGKRNKAAITRTSGKQEDVAETSVLSAMFRGILKSSVKAKGVQAAKPSVTIQPFTTLQLHLVENVRSIEDALEAMTHTELIHDYMVKGFEQGVDAEKSVKLSKLPQVRVGHEGCWRSQ
eukprot:GHRR01034246.1.p1 GENE.GHRR01034246.1~~GHRR01034246.1.p1  ORF type:complete len:395 (+),score=178.44 GHRR01034246.1:731-1915(+)